VLFITTDHIMPAGAQVLPLRSNISGIAEYVFWRVDPDFVQRSKEWGGGFEADGAYEAVFRYSLRWRHHRRTRQGLLVRALPDPGVGRD